MTGRGRHRSRARYVEILNTAVEFLDDRRNSTAPDRLAAVSRGRPTRGVENLYDPRPAAC